MLIDREISRWARARTKFDAERWKIKNSPLYSFSENRLPEANGLLTDCGAQGKAATRGRKGPYVGLYMCRHEEVGNSRRGRRVLADRETVVNSVGGGAGGDKAPQCGAVDTTTTTHPLIRDLSPHPGLQTSTLLSSLSPSFSFCLDIIALVRYYRYGFFDSERTPVCRTDACRHYCSILAQADRIDKSKWNLQDKVPVKPSSPRLSCDRSRFLAPSQTF